MERVKRFFLAVPGPTTGWLAATGTYLLIATQYAFEQDWRRAIINFGLMMAALVFAHNSYVKHLTSNALDTSRRDST